MQNIAKNTAAYTGSLKQEEFAKMEKSRLDREEIGKIALLKDISEEEKICEIDHALLNYYKG